MSQTVTFKVTIEMPEEMYVNALRRYVRDAVTSWSGGGDPDDPLFGWFHDDKSRLKIQSIKSEK